MKESLAIIMPVYNEEGAIGGVLHEWAAVLDRIEDLEYRIHAYNDGSRDRTAEILDGVARERPASLAVHSKANSGHGPTILLGYREHWGAADWLFQIDSDGEIGPEHFRDLWTRRHEYDFLIGMRENRRSPLSRRAVSFVSRMTVQLFFGAGVRDVNCPFRLMRSAMIGPVLSEIPEDTFAPNVMLSGLACRLGWRVSEVAVQFRERRTGEVSIKKWKLLKAAWKSFRQTVTYARGGKGQNQRGA